MRLSVIVPVLNEAAGIVSALEALAPLRRRGAEIIVVDGGSTDDTVARAMALTDQLIQTGCGRARQMNAGAAAASGEVLLFLHADTLLPDNADLLVLDGLMGLMGLMGPTASGRTWGRFDVRIDGRPRLLRVIALMMNLRSRLTGIATGDQAIFVLCDQFISAGGFPEQALMEDIALSRRLKACSRPLCLKAQVVTSGRRWEQHGVWRTIFLMWRLRWRYWLGASPEDLARAYR